MRKKIENALFELGITPDLTGFDYIRCAIEIILSSKDRVQIVKGLYADIAKQFNTRSQLVERAIRYAFSKMDKESEVFIKYFGLEKPTNSVLLYTLAYRLREK